jgi:hypothetical protein
VIGRRRDDNGAIEITPAQRFDRLERIAVVNVAATAVLVVIHAPEFAPVWDGLQRAATIGNAAAGVALIGVAITFRGLVG